MIVQLQNATQYYYKTITQPPVTYTANNHANYL